MFFENGLHDHVLLYQLYVKWMNTSRNIIQWYKGWQYTIIAFIWGEHRKLSTRRCFFFIQRDLARGKTTSLGLPTWYSRNMKAMLFYHNETTIRCLLLEYFAEDNKIISGIENTITEPDWKKTPEFQHTSVCQGL